MIRNVWTVLCREILTDQETNSVSYIQCVEEGSASRLPVQIGPLYLGTLWEKTGTEGDTVQFRVLLAPPGGARQAVLQTRPLVLDRPRHRLHFRINSLRLEEFGLYTVVLEFLMAGTWNEGARLPVYVRQLESQQPEQRQSVAGR